MAARNISFNGNNLQTAAIVTQDIDAEGIATKENSKYPLANSNGSVISHVNYPDKTITIKGQVKADSTAELDGLLDSFRGYFIGTDKNLDFDYAGDTRRYIATLNSLDIKRPGGLQYANFTAGFDCTQSFGRAITTTTALSATGRTLASYSDTYTFTGTAPYQLPIITITYSAITGGTAQSVTFGNNANAQQITVTGNWVSGDVVTIDCEAKLVNVNGVLVDFDGAFPAFEPGDGIMGYTDGFTTRTFDINVAYYKLFL